MGDAPILLLQGSLDLLSLTCLSLVEMRRLAIAGRIVHIAKAACDVKPGSLFAALHRLEGRGWLASSGGDSDNHRRAKYYRLTTAGRRQLADEIDDWKRVAESMSFALNT